MYTAYPTQPPQMGVEPPQVGVVPAPQPKPKSPAKSKENDVGGFIQQLIGLAAYVHQLQVQSHLMHFNYEGPNFLGVHKFLGKQYEAHQEQFDKIGEFIRSMDYYLPMCHNGLMSASPEFKHSTSYKANEMLGEDLGMKTKKLEADAGKIRAIDIQNYMAELCGEAFKAAWMILSYGPIKQFMNSPLEIMVDAPDWGYAGREYLTKEAFPAIQEMYPGNTANQIQKRIKEREKYSGKYGGIIIDDLGELEYITNRAKIPSNYSKEQFAADYKGFDPTQVQSGSDKDFDRYVQYMQDQDRAVRGYSLEPDDAYYKRLENEQLKGFNVQANELPYKPTTYTAAKHGFSGNNTEFTQSSALANPSLQHAYDKLFAIAKNRGSLRNIIKGATTATTDIAGAIPLFDPEFRQAVEKGDVRKAATQVAKEYATGVVAAPVIGMGVGALNQVAPRAARIVAGGLNAARTVNPIAVVSQLGGSSKINKKADEQAAKSQLLRAEAARKRGGKWKFPTPFGTLQIPELGLSEAGGLFFR
jgi:DNA-binding ferritin-like protein